MTRVSSAIVHSRTPRPGLAILIALVAFASVVGLANESGLSAFAPGSIRATFQTAFPLVQAAGTFAVFVLLGLLASVSSGRRWIGILLGLVVAIATQAVIAVTGIGTASLAFGVVGFVGSIVGAAFARTPPRRPTRQWDAPRTSPGRTSGPFADLVVTSGSRRRSHRGRNVLLVMLTGVVLVVALLAALLVLVVPSTTDAHARASALADSRGVRAPVLPIPARVADALTATEDQNFETSVGLDPAGVARWTISTLTGSADTAAGSTLEQQLAKMLYTDGNSTTVDRFEQLGLALKLDQHWSKAQIMQMYLESAYFGHGFYGLDAASKGYFGVSAARLDWQQAALLVGLVQAPTAYDPFTHPDLAKSRRSHVLDRLVATGHLTDAEAAKADSSGLGLIGG